jgi:predicted Zn-dependent protease
MFRTEIIAILPDPCITIMQSINVLTINEEPKNEQDLVKIAENAIRYFPTRTWDDVRYLGKLSSDHDVKVAANGEFSGAFLFEKLIQRIRRIGDSYKAENFLLGITSDPVVAVYCFFEGEHLKRTAYLVHDYMIETVGVVSLFRVKEGASSKVVAHGLGHSKGLLHHAEPIDLMYSELLEASKLKVEGFCKLCLCKLTRA